MESKLGKQIGSGGTSTVYEWGEHEVIKIFKDHVSEGAIDLEEYIGKILNKYSLEMPKYKGTIEIDGKRAIIYDRVDGTVFGEALLKSETLNMSEAANLFAEKHYAIHKHLIEELPSQYEFLKNRLLELETILGERAFIILQLLDEIQTEDKLCHGDYQPMNIIVDESKYVIIDWNNAFRGNPILDVAWTYLTLNSPVIQYMFGVTVSEVVREFTKEYLSHYCNISNINEKEVIECLPIVAARRLYDNNMCENDMSRLEKEWLYDYINSIS